MSRRGAVVVFPGQGFLDQSPYADGDLRARYAAVAAEMAADAHERAVSLCERPLLTHEALSLFIYTASIAHYRALQALGLQPAALVGHGFGEIVALVCGGAFDVAQGAELTLQRSEAFRHAAGEAGRMVVARTSRSVAERLVHAVGGGRVAVAAENSASEIVLSGTTRAIDALVALARQQSIAVRPLRAGWPLHCRATMQRAADEFAARVKRHRAAALHTPVFSPILERYYGDFEDYADCLSRHLTSTVEFAAGLETLQDEGLRSFLPCGPLRGLDRCIAELVRARRRSHEVTSFAATPRGPVFRLPQMAATSDVHEEVERRRVAGRM